MKNIFKLIGIIVIVSVIALSMSACRSGDDDDNGDNGDNVNNSSGYWLISNQKTYLVKDGIVNDSYSNSSETNYTWIAYRYTNETNYEEEYITFSSTRSDTSNENYRYSSENNSYSEYYYIRNGQTSSSTTDTITMNWSYGSNQEEKITVSSAESSTTSTYDLASGLTASTTTVSSGVTTGAVYSIELLSDTGGVKTYKYYYAGSNGYNIYKFQNGKTIEVSYYDAAGMLSYTVKYTYTGDTTQASSYDANNVLLYISTTTKPDNKVIRERLPKFTLYSTTYYSSSYSIKSSYQTVEVLQNYTDSLVIRVRTFSDSVLSSQTDYTYYRGLTNRNGGSFDSSGFYYINRGNSIEITGYARRGGTVVTIPAQINGKPVTKIASSAFRNCYKLTSVTIPNSVTKIDGVAFERCISLTSITIPDSVTSIGEYAFERCISLTSVTIPNSVTSIGAMAFELCTSLASVTIGNGVTSIGTQAFELCTSLTSVTIGNRVTSIGIGAFHGCESLTSVTIPNSVTSIDRLAFCSCTNLTSVTFQGTIAAENFGSNEWNPPFEGDLRAKYLAGGIGTYTRSGYTWTKQQ